MSAAAYLGIDASTISHAAKRDAEFAASLLWAEEMSGVQPLLSLIAASRTNWRAAAWFLKYRYQLPTPATSTGGGSVEAYHAARLERCRLEAEVEMEMKLQSQLHNEKLRDLEEARKSERRRAEWERNHPPRNRKAKGEAGAANGADPVEKQAVDNGQGRV